MSVRDSSQLYEYWCFIKLYEILRSRYTLKSPDIIKVDRKGVTVDLVKGRPSRMTFLNTKTGERIYLAYNPSETETETQTVNQKPDNVLALEKKGSVSAYKYVFDAKYRIDAYTNFFLLSNSSSYSELFLKNEDEYRFFAGLKRMTDKAVLEDEDEATAFDLEGLKVLLDKKRIYVVNDGELEEKYRVQEFVRHPNRTFKRLMKYREMVMGE